MITRSVREASTQDSGGMRADGLLHAAGVGVSSKIMSLGLSAHKIAFSCIRYEATDPTPAAVRAKIHILARLLRDNAGRIRGKANPTEIAARKRKDCKQRSQRRVAHEPT